MRPETPVERFAGCIRFPTLSSPDGFSLEPFHEMHSYSRECWPLVFSMMEPSVFGGASLLFRWIGKDPDLEPLLLTAHQDVVPASPEDSWLYPPFAGTIHEGRVHGRGAIDFKCGYAGILEACDTLLRQGFSPARTVLLAMGHDEETGGAEGAGKITRFLEDRGTRCAMVLDEGGYIHQVPWLVNPVAMVGVAEKGYATFEVRASAPQGHSSVPSPATVAEKIARAVTVIAENPWPSRVLPELRPLFPDGSASEAEKTPFGSALLRTTMAVTVIRAGEKENVLPSSGTMTVNCRTIPGDSSGSLRDRLEGLMEPLGLSLRLLETPSLSEPSSVSSVDCPGYSMLTGAARKFSGGLQVLPGIFVAATDSRHYSRISRNVYRFCPVRLDGRGVGMLHSAGESIAVEDYGRCAGFYREVITGFCS